MILPFPKEKDTTRQDIRIIERTANSDPSTGVYEEIKLIFCRFLNPLFFQFLNYFLGVFTKFFRQDDIYFYV